MPMIDKWKAIRIASRLLGVIGASTCFVQIASAQGYNENRTLGFRVVNQDGNLRLGKEVSRQSLSALRNSSVSAGSGSARGTAAQQQGSDLNNVVQYYNNSSLTITVPGSNSPVTVDGGVLNAGQTSSGTSQVLNNQTQGTVTNRPQ